MHYSSPSVQGRTLWGGIVPYDQVWRAGANENTTISFDTPVTTGGKTLSAGTYGVHMIPTEADWTVILSTDHDAWGSYFYNEANDVARIQVTPQKHGSTEWLTYSVVNRTASSATVAMMWGELTIPFEIETDLAKNLEIDFQEQMTGLVGFNWSANNQYANYYLQQGTNLDAALKAVNQSIGMNKQFANLSTKALILSSLGESEEAANIEKEAMEMANEAQLNTYGYQLVGLGKMNEALIVFKKNTKDHPKSWNAWDSLGECHLNMGNKKDAKKYYEKALGMAPDNQKARIEGILNTI